MTYKLFPLNFFKKVFSSDFSNIIWSLYQLSWTFIDYSVWTHFFKHMFSYLMIQIVSGMESLVYWITPLVLSCITLFRNSSTILKAALEVSARNVSFTEHLCYKNFVSFCANKRRHSLLNISNAFFPKDETLQGGIDSFCETICNQDWLDHRDILWFVVNV